MSSHERIRVSLRSLVGTRQAQNMTGPVHLLGGFLARPFLRIYAASLYCSRGIIVVIIYIVIAGIGFASPRQRARLTMLFDLGLPSNAPQTL